MPERSVVFVDGNNWYHSLTNLGISNLGRFNYAKVSRKLVGPREWTATRYYVGQVRQQENTILYSAQRRYMAWLGARSPRISIHYGRLEQRPRNDAAAELKRYLAELKVRIDPAVYKDLLSLAVRHAVVSVTVEKAVDVMLAVDMVRMAERNEYDTAYLLSPGLHAGRQGGCREREEGIRCISDPWCTTRASGVQVHSAPAFVVRRLLR
jgi:uncharacterized LabA/DUF88 family protein